MCTVVAVRQSLTDLHQLRQPSCLHQLCADQDPQTRVLVPGVVNSADAFSSRQDYQAA
jgi:hypothetical protein